MSKDYLCIPDDSAATKSIERSPFTSGRLSRIGMLQQDNDEFVNFSDEENAVTLSLDAFNISMKNTTRFRETTLNRTQRDKNRDVDEGSEYLIHEDNDTDEHNNVSNADVCVDKVLQTECYSSEKDSTSGHASDNSLYEGESESSGMGQDCEDDLTSYESEVFDSDISETSLTPPYETTRDASTVETSQCNQSENGSDLEKDVNTLSSNTTLKFDETVKINESRLFEVDTTSTDIPEANIPDPALETEEKTIRMQTCNTTLSEKHGYNKNREYNPNNRNKSPVQRKMLDTASDVKSRFRHSDSDTFLADSKQSMKRRQTYTSASQKQCNQVKSHSSTKLSTNVIRHISELPVIEASQRRNRSRNNVKYESPDNRSTEKYTGRNKRSQKKHITDKELTLKKIYTASKPIRHKTRSYKEAKVVDSNHYANPPLLARHKTNSTSMKQMDVRKPKVQIKPDVFYNVTRHATHESVTRGVQLFQITTHGSSSKIHHTTRHNTKPLNINDLHQEIDANYTKAIAKHEHSFEAFEAMHGKLCISRSTTVCSNETETYARAQEHISKYKTTNTATKECNKKTDKTNYLDNKNTRINTSASNKHRSLDMATSQNSKNVLKIENGCHLAPSVSDHATSNIHESNYTDNISPTGLLREDYTTGNWNINEKYGSEILSSEDNKEEALRRHIEFVQSRGIDINIERNSFRSALNRPKFESVVPSDKHKLAPLPPVVKSSRVKSVTVTKPSSGDKK